MKNHQPIWGEASLKPQELRIYRIYTVLEFRWISWVKGLVLLNLQESRFLWTPNWLVRFLVDCPLNQFWELSVCRRNYIFGRATWYARKQILRGRKFWLCCFRWSAHIKFTLLDQWQRETALFAFILPHVPHPVATAMITWASFSHFFKASTPRRKLVNQHDFLAGPKTVVSIPHTWPIPIPQTFLGFFKGSRSENPFVWGCPKNWESNSWRFVPAWVPVRSPPAMGHGKSPTKGDWGQRYLMCVSFQSPLKSWPDLIESIESDAKQFSPEGSTSKCMAAIHPEEENVGDIFWLVVDLPLWKIWKSVGMIIPNIWKHKKCSKPPTSISSTRGWEEEHNYWCVTHEESCGSTHQSTSKKNH